jgi:hypothetical protein
MFHSVRSPHGRVVTVRRTARPIARLLLATLFSGFVANAATATVRCTCPSVSAKGEGSTSCTASEANGGCVVDFNAFDDREERAAAFITKVGGKLPYAPDRGLSASDAVERASSNPTALASVISLYLAVSLSAQRDAPNVREAMESIVNALTFKYPDQLLQVFAGHSGATLNPNTIGSQFEGIITQGCIELTVNQVWVMFKLATSPVAEADRCGK